MKKQEFPLAQYLLLGLLFVGSCAYQVRATIAAFPGFLGKGSVAWPFIPSYAKGLPHATFVRPEARKAGVAERDILIQVDGKPFTGKVVFGEAIRTARPGDNLLVAVESPNTHTERTLAIPLAAASATLNWTVAFVVMLKVVMPAFNIALGFWVAFVRPRDIAAWLLLGVLLGLSNLFSAGTESWGWGVRDLGTFYFATANELWAICMLYFGLYFPEPFPPGRARAWVWLATKVIVPLLVIDAVVEVVVEIGSVENYASVARLDGFWQHFSPFWFFTSGPR